MYLLAKTISLISTAYLPPYQYWRREIRKKIWKNFYEQYLYTTHRHISYCTSTYFIHILSHTFSLSFRWSKRYCIFAVSSTTSIYQITSQLLDRLTWFIFNVYVFIYNWAIFDFVTDFSQHTWRIQHTFCHNS